MVCYKNPDKSGQSFVQICCFLYMALMQFNPGETVAPYSAKKVTPDPCPTYKYLAKDENGNSKCRRCSQCPNGFQVVTKCSISNDTVCEQCPSGWFNEDSSIKCKLCSKCKPGEYIRRECSSKRNTSCRPCPRHMFSVSSNSSRCMPCRTCRRNEETLSKCNSFHDTECGDCEKDYFRVSSTGSCLKCSQCPSKLQTLVVPECRDKLGINNPNICWPGYTRSLSSDFYGLSKSSEDVTNGNNGHTDEEATVDSVSLPILLCMLGTILGGLVVIIFTFICLRQLLPTRYSSLNTSTMYEPSSIPLSPILTSTNESLQNSFDSGISQHSNIEHTYYPSTDRAFDLNTDFKPETLLKHSTRKCNNYLQEALSSRSQSEPASVYSSDAPVSLLADFSNTDTRRLEAFGYFTDSRPFHECKSNGTF